MKHEVRLSLHHTTTVWPGAGAGKELGGSVFEEVSETGKRKSAHSAFPMGEAAAHVFPPQRQTVARTVGEENSMSLEPQRHLGARVPWLLAKVLEPLQAKFKITPH